jgi:hypothetical protein
MTLSMASRSIGSWTNSRLNHEGIGAHFSICRSLHGPLQVYNGIYVRVSPPSVLSSGVIITILETLIYRFQALYRGE